MIHSPAVVLLDTHAFLWFALGDELLSEVARTAIEKASVAYVSAASVWEIRTRHRLGKLSAAAGIASGLPSHIQRLGLTPLAIDVEDGDLAAALAGAHRDPFDRMLAAQAIRRGTAIVSNDTVLDAFGVTRCW